MLVEIISVKDFKSCFSEALFMPTRQVAFSRLGTTVYMVKPSAEACAQYHMDGSPEPFYIYWENSSGQTAKINVAKAIINACKEVHLFSKLSLLLACY